MNTHAIKKILTQIREKYRQLVSITETAHLGSKVALHHGFIEKRRGLLQEINTNQVALKDYDGWQQQCNEDRRLQTLSREIRMLISTILALDEVIKKKLTLRIDKVKTELGSLNRNAQVALSYAKNTNRGY